MEEWRVSFHSEKYEVSSFGNIRRIGKQDFLKPSFSGTGGYGLVQLGAKNAKKVHTVVAETFLGKRPVGLDINHIDGNKRNNKLDNLEYVTRSENCRQACNEQKLRDMSKEKHSRAKLSNNNVASIKIMIAEGIRNVDIASMFNVDASLISHIKRGIKWV